MNENSAQQLIKKTKAAYNEFAEDFSETRSHAWPEFKWIKKFIGEGTKVLELGCGNGRLYEELKDKRIDYTGIDFSEKLLEIAKKKYPKLDFITQDITKLDTEGETYDVIVSIAALHHIPGKKLRKETLQKIHETLRDDGTLIISVWNLWQKKYRGPIVKAFLRSIYTLGKHDYNDCFIPWKSNNKKPIMRYYHAFTENELKSLLKKTGFEIVDKHQAKAGEKNRNFTYVCKKKVAKAQQNPLFNDPKKESSLSNQPQPATSQKL